MIVMELAMFPLDKGSSLSEYVASVVRVVKDSGMPHQLGPMGTTIEGEWDDLNALLKKCYQTLEPVSDRFYMMVKMDCRRGATNRLTGKVDSVTRKL